jgi:hypothetical protein
MDTKPRRWMKRLLGGLAGAMLAAITDSRTSKLVDGQTARCCHRA